MSKKEINIPYRPRPIQKWLHDNLKRYNIIVAHRRFGKSVFGGGELMDKAFANPLPNPTYAFISPTFAMAKRIIWTYMKDFLKDVPGVKFTENDLTITIPRGDRDVIKFYLLSAETPDSIVGIYLDGVIIDEYSLMKGNLFDVFNFPLDEQLNTHRNRFNNIITTWRWYRDWETDRKSTRLNSSHSGESRMPSSA